MLKTMQALSKSPYGVGMMTTSDDEMKGNNTILFAMATLKEEIE